MANIAPSRTAEAASAQAARLQQQLALTQATQRELEEIGRKLAEASTDTASHAAVIAEGAEAVMNTFVGPPLGSALLLAAFSIPFFVHSGTFFAAAGAVDFR